MENKLLTGYVLGFIDAEASFSVSIKLQKGLAYGIRLDPVFSITQQEKAPLEIIRQVIGIGRIIRKPGQRHLYLLVIDSMKDLREKLIPFLNRYENVLTAKKRNYELFREIVEKMLRKEHRKPESLKQLVKKAYLLSNLSSKAYRKRRLQEILSIIDYYCSKRRDSPGER